MDEKQYLKNLSAPQGPVDVVLDTDAYNEVDDQYAIAYLLRSGEKLRLQAICAAPFSKDWVSGPAEGMERSYQEIGNILKLVGREDLQSIVCRGSERFLENEQTPVSSPAAELMAKLADSYTPEKPLYIIAIGAITNVASAILKNPRMKENCVVVWLGGHGTHIPQACTEFNMRQDIAAARVVFDSGVPLVLLPCKGVVDRFAASKYEMQYWLKGKNALCDYLYEHTVRTAESYAAGKPWTRVIWDVTAVAWLLDGEERFMWDRLIPCPVPEYDQTYTCHPDRRLIRCVYWVNRDALFEDLFGKLCENDEAV